jgi:hypothetical protein
MPPGNMPLGDHQSLASRQGIDIQDAYRQIIFVDLMRVGTSLHNLAKDAGSFRILVHLFHLPSFPSLLFSSYAARIENTNDYF